MEWQSYFHITRVTTMSLESASTISGLQASNPAGSDTQLQGYQHLQLIKSVLKLQFPGAGGQGYNVPITAKETELNYLAGVTSNVQTQLNFLQAEIAALSGVTEIPAGTAMVFAQATAPTGWTQLTTWSNHMLRVVSTAGGNSGGSMSPILNNIVPSHTHSFTSDPVSVDHTHTILTDTAAAHTHSYYLNASAASAQAGGGVSANTGIAASATGSAGAHSHAGNTDSVSNTVHTHTGTTQVNGSASNWTPFYLDTIVCTKN